MTRIRGFVHEPRKVGRGKPSVKGFSNDLSLHSLVGANAASIETVGAGPFGTVTRGEFVVVVPFTQTRFFDTTRQVNTVLPTFFVDPTVEHAAAWAYRLGIASGSARAMIVDARNRFIAQD